MLCIIPCHHTRSNFLSTLHSYPHYTNEEIKSEKNCAVQELINCGDGSGNKATINPPQSTLLNQESILKVRVTIKTDDLLRHKFWLY